MRPSLIPVLFGQTLEPEVTAWLNRVASNGGTVSTNTRKAVNNFVRQAKAAGIWSLFTRLNLCCGSYLASLVPIVTTIGPTTETPIVLGAGDYSEGTGWVTDGSTKYIDTGTVMGASGSTGSLSVYCRTTQASAATGRFICGASSVGGSSQYSLRANRDASNITVSGAVSGLWGGANVGAAPATTGGYLAGMWQVTRRSATDAELYLNGVSRATATNSISAVSSVVSMYLFAVNNGGGVAGFSEANTSISGYGVLASMTTAQALAYYNIMQAFQTALSRQV